MTTHPTDPASIPRAPVGAMVILILLYLPWLITFLVPARVPAEEGDDMMFPGGIIYAFLCLAYLITAIALSVYLYRRRSVSHGYKVSFYASLGPLALLTVFLWRVA
jgi:hypothetical protein